MSDTQVYMDIPAVKDIAKNFNTISDVLSNVVKVMDVLTNTLKVTAFIGLVGGYAVAQFIDSIKPQIEKMAEKCAELSKDVAASVAAYERGDAEGAARFH